MDCKKAQSLVRPYIKRQLDEEEASAFVEHISRCPECREELEIYFTIHFALQKLDEEQDVSYNIKKMLEDDLEMTERRVRGTRIFRFCGYGIMLAAEIFLLLGLITQAQLWMTGSVRQTFAYRTLYGHESVPVPGQETEQKTDGEIYEQKNSTD